MRRPSKQHKIRVITQERHRITYGVTIPSTYAHWVGVLVNIQESGNTLILESGAVPGAINLKTLKGQAEIIDRIKI